MTGRANHMKDEISLKVLDDDLPQFRSLQYSGLI